MEENPEDNRKKIYFLTKAKSQCKPCDITFKNKKMLEMHKKSIHGPTPNRDKSSSKNERVSTTVNDERVSPVTKSDLKKHINEISEKINIPLEMHEVTPAIGNCWYEVCASLMKLNKMRDISAKILEKR